MTDPESPMEPPRESPAEPWGSTSHQDLRELVERLPDPLLLFRQGRVVYANRRAVDLLDQPAGEILGQHWEGLFRDNDHRGLSLAMRHLERNHGQQSRVELHLPVAEEETSELEGSLSSIEIAGEQTVLMSLRDVSAAKQTIQEVQQQAYKDSLTGLANRTLFYDRLEREIIRSRRTGRPVVLMFIDLDRFKWVNDTLGHDAGDDLLREVARRLGGMIRQSDTLARLGGDEFTLILPDMSKVPDAERVTKKILEDLSRPFLLKGQEVVISGSIGISVYPGDAEDSYDLLKKADTAMYLAKREGRNAYRFFTEEMHAEVMQRIALEKSLQRAIEADELVMHYQPIIDIENHRLIGMESFLRWNKADAGLIPPILFLTVAEEIGLSAPFTEWVLRQVCEQRIAWQDTPALNDLFVTINLSCSRCRSYLSSEFLHDLLEECCFTPSQLILEITENILGDDEETTLQHLEKLKHLGVGLWLDDFGVGQSSLNLLNRLPLDGFKIDQNFIGKMLDHDEDAVLVDAMLSLAAKLELQVIAEGIETTEQKTFLLNKGCRLGQGYLYAPPLPGDEFKRWALDYMAAAAG